MWFVFRSDLSRAQARSLRAEEEQKSAKEERRRWRNRSLPWGRRATRGRRRRFADIDRAASVSGRSGMHTKTVCAAAGRGVGGP